VTVVHIAGAHVPFQGYGFGLHWPQHPAWDVKKKVLTSDMYSIESQMAIREKIQVLKIQANNNNVTDYVEIYMQHLEPIDYHRLKWEPLIQKLVEAMNETEITLTLIDETENTKAQALALQGALYGSGSDINNV
ncbi:unnamed protein product, partial [Didymodactylos carnosus]